MSFSTPAASQGNPTPAPQSPLLQGFNPSQLAPAPRDKNRIAPAQKAKKPKPLANFKLVPKAPKAAPAAPLPPEPPTPMSAGSV